MEYINIQLNDRDYRLLERLVQAKEKELALKDQEILLDSYRADVSHLMDKVQKLQEYKEKIEKLPEYESWVAGFNCGGYHD